MKLTALALLATLGATEGLKCYQMVGKGEGEVPAKAGKPAGGAGAEVVDFLADVPKNDEGVPVDENGAPLSKNAIKKLRKQAEAAAKKAAKAAEKAAA